MGLIEGKIEGTMAGRITWGGGIAEGTERITRER